MLDAAECPGVRSGDGDGDGWEECADPNGSRRGIPPGVGWRCWLELPGMCAENRPGVPGGEASTVDSLELLSSTALSVDCVLRELFRGNVGARLGL